MLKAFFMSAAAQDKTNRDSDWSRTCNNLTLAQNDTLMTQALQQQTRLNQAIVTTTTRVSYHQQMAHPGQQQGQLTLASPQGR